MRFFLYVGWGLLLTAFVITAADPFLTLLGTGGMWAPTYDVWYAYSPRTLIITQIRFEKYAPVLWDPVIVTVLQLPGWLLFGVPGVATVWHFRAERTMSAQDREDFERQKESLFVLDELSREAMSHEDYDPLEDDRAPAHLLFDLHESEDEDIRDAVIRGDIPAGYPTPKYLEEWSVDLTRDDADGMGGINDERLTDNLDVASLPPSGSIVIAKNEVSEDTSPAHDLNTEGVDRKSKGDK